MDLVIEMVALEVQVLVDRMVRHAVKVAEVVAQSETSQTTRKPAWRNF